MENGRRGEVIVYINISFFTTVSPRNATLKELEVKSILLESPVIPTLSSSTLSIGLLGVSALLGTSTHGGVLYRILAIASNRAASASSAATRSSSLNLSFSSCLCFRASALSRFCYMSCSCLYTEESNAHVPPRLVLAGRCPQLLSKYLRAGDFIKLTRTPFTPHRTIHSHTIPKVSPRGGCSVVWV